MWVAALYVAAIAVPFVFPQWFFRTVVSTEFSVKPLQAKYFKDHEVSSDSSASSESSASSASSSDSSDSSSNSEVDNVNVNAQTLTMCAKNYYATLADANSDSDNTMHIKNSSSLDSSCEVIGDIGADDIGEEADVVEFNGVHNM